MASPGTFMPSTKILLLLLAFVIHFYKEWKILGFRNYSLYINRSFIKMIYSNKFYFRGSKSHGMEIKNVEKLTYLIRGKVEQIYIQSIKLSWNRFLFKNMAGKQILTFRIFNEWYNVKY